uniref:Tetratricopeptide repeat protein 6 n=1 Tax=Strix occidentalis caurina TaxID=311401 RepID=A0A8D0KZV6_STROC
IECFCEATATHPEPSMFVILGKIQMKAKKTKDAVRSFKKAMKLLMTSAKILPNTFEAAEMYYLTGLCYLEQKNLLQVGINSIEYIRLCRMQLRQAKCIRDFNRALALCPSHFQACMSCAAYYGSKGRYSKAILNRNEAIKILPNSVQNLGKLQRAWRQFTVAICIDPKCHAAYDRRTSVCLLMGETFAAFQDTNAAIKLTTTAPLLTNWGVINELIGYLPCAMKDYQQAISVDTNYALAYFNAANIYFHNRQFSQAYCYYSKVLQLDPRNESAVMNRAITNTLLNNIAEAKEDFEKSICLCPFSAAVYSLQQGKFIQWIEATLTTLSIQPNDALIYKFRADIHSKLGFNKEAVEDYKQAISFQEQIDSM